MTDVEKVIKVHEEQVASGYTCVDKKSKYAKDIDDNYPDWYNGKKYGYDWCTVYFDWCMIKAFGEEKARKILNRPKKSLGAGVRYSREYLKSIGRVGNEPKVGCAVYFGTLPYPHHIGFVYKVTDKMIYTYEGNCYVSKGVSGVKARSYNRSYKDILDYGYPVYDESPEPSLKELDGYKVGNTYQCVVDDLSVRKGAGTNYAKVADLKEGDKILCSALCHDSDGNTWMQFDKGWACAIWKDTRYIAEPVEDGWVKRDGKWYYYYDGVMLKGEWLRYKGDMYYLDDDGVMVTDWQIVNRCEYYFYADGHMANSEWVDGYCINHDGKVDKNVKAKWKHNAKGWWFEDSNGWYPKNRHVVINRIEYEFDEAGYLIEDRNV